MANLSIRLRNALGAPLGDVVDIHAKRVHAPGGKWYLNRKSRRPITIGGLQTGRYLIKVLPKCHRSAAKFVFVDDDTLVSSSRAPSIRTM